MKKGKNKSQISHNLPQISALHSFGSRKYSKMSAIKDLMSEFDMEMTLQAVRTEHEEIEGEFDEKRMF